MDGLRRLDLSPSYQRRSVWTRRDRQFFLDTIFNNYPSPAIFLHKDVDEYSNPTYHVVDGKQRLETILMFVANKLPIRDNFGDDRLNGKRWKDLADDINLRRRLLDYQITVEMLDSIEQTVVNEVFGRLNQNSRKLTPQEIRHARYNGWFINRAEQEAESPIWKDLKIATAGRFKRMQDTQFISELMTATIAGTVVGFDQDSLDETYAEYEYPEDLEPPFSTEEFNDEFGRVKAFVHDLEREYGTVTKFANNLAHFYSLWVYLISLDGLPDLGRFNAAYVSFMEMTQIVDGADSEGDFLTIPDDFVPLVRKYQDSARGATTDNAPRVARHEALQSALSLLMQ